jgi:cell division protease FtsH
LGVTWMMPLEDTYLSSKAKFMDEMVTLLWGRAAEEIFFWKDYITTGASNDFERVTKIASDMIMKYGMDDELWQIVYLDRDKWERQSFKPFSEQTAQIIDSKIKFLVETAYHKAVAILKWHQDLVEKLASILYEKEYLSKEEFEEVMKAPADQVDEIIERMRTTYRTSLEAIEKK